MRDWCSSWPPGSSRRSGASPRHGCQRPQIGADEVNPLTTSAFDLPDRLSAKADPALIAADEQHFAAIADSLEETIADLSDRLDAERKAPGGIGQEAMDRDMEIHRLTARLGSSRSPRMRDVLGTIQADQDAIIRAGSRGALVVDGGPGTGKTVVALHRTAYLLYSDPRLGHRRGGVLFVGPHQPYLAYVSDVLPSLGEEGVQTCTLRDLLPEGATAGPEADPAVARLKSSADMVKAIEPAVRFYENPPTAPMTVETPWAD